MGAGWRLLSIWEPMSMHSVQTVGGVRRFFALRM